MCRQYEILHGKTTVELTDKVNRHFKEDWCLYGEMIVMAGALPGPQPESWVFFQVVVRDT